MPLKIESGTYTVNRRATAGIAGSAPPAKKLSKFTLWRHWRRSVHEERGSSEERRPAGGGGDPRHEVAGLVAVESAPTGGGEGGGGGAFAGSGGGVRTSRRSRPHSLAVQPLHYQRLDPELQQLEPALQPLVSTKRSTTTTTAAAEQQQLQAAVVAATAAAAATATTATVPANRGNMTSQESIGSCSLDVERSASERSDVNAGSLSEKTLHSLNLSCNGDQPSIRVTSGCVGGENVEGEELICSNGHERGDGASSADLQQEQQQLTAKKPSYLGLACSISGYSGITRYDSKLREGFRSRDSSPGARLITRDTSPAGFRSHETLNVPAHNNPPKSQSISPLAMERHHNGFANGVRDKCKIESYLESGRGINSHNQGYSEVGRATTVVVDQLSPIHSSSLNKRSGSGSTRIATYNQQNRSYTSISNSSSKSAHANVSHPYSELSILNGSTELDGCALNTSATSEKSFIQQRVERLYGPGALAQGFFFKRSSANKLDLSDASNKSSNNNNTSIDYTNDDDDESLKSLPVLRHLRPEFRAQLPVVSPRRPTDGSEQIIKPLKRISLSPGKNDAKETKAVPVKTEVNAKNDTKMTASVTSLTDQQPAAPKVVLPVLEPSANLTKTPKEGAKAPEKVEEKNGHYFMNLLNQERERLISLAEAVETELSDSQASTLPEEAAGKLRSAAGKARLLASQKMKQFEGLCQKNINQVPGEEFPTTAEDLAGFWDMVMLQVVQVNNLFEQIDALRKLQWKEVIPEPKSTPTTPHNGNAIKRRQTPASKAKSSANTEAARKAREVREQTRRQLIEERRRAMRSNASKSDNSVEIFVPET